jgi:hypothetical protein
MLINYALFSKEFANIRILIQIGNKDLKNIFAGCGVRRLGCDEGCLNLDLTIAMIKTI